MKLIFAIVIINCLSVSLLFSQNHIGPDNFKLEGVVEMKALSKDQLFQRAKLWTLSTLKPSDNLIFMDDEQCNSIVAAANLIFDGGRTSIDYKITIAFKDGRYKYTIDHLFYNYIVFPINNGAVQIVVAMESLKFGKNRKAEIYKETNEKLKLVIVGLEQSMVNPVMEDSW